MVRKVDCQPLIADCQPLRAGDIILTLNGQLITRVSEFDIMYTNHVLDALVVRSGQVGLSGTFSTLFGTQAGFTGWPTQKKHSPYPDLGIPRRNSNEDKPPKWGTREMLKMLKLQDNPRTHLRMFLDLHSRDISSNLMLTRARKC